MTPRFDIVRFAITAVVTSVFILAIGLFSGPSAAQLAAPPDPAPDPGSPDQHIFYGAIPPFGQKGPVLVFVHGYGGTARDWFVGNDMYVTAFSSQYRTAFVSLSRDNTRNSASIEDNSQVLRDALPKIAARYSTNELYLIGHSKGGVDVQAALFDKDVADLVRAVFTISSPNQGTELADWAFDHPALAASLNLLTRGVAAMRTDAMAVFRQIADPILRARGIPFYTLGGDRFTDNAFTAITGLIIADLVPGQPNDGFVTLARTKLPAEYSSNLGRLHTHHFNTDSGSTAFIKIDGQVQSLQNMLKEFGRATSAGLGDQRNSWVWSMEWFKGKLYVGTGREVDCMTFSTADVQLGTNLYPLIVAAGHCPDLDTFSRSLAAEIWSFDPQTLAWRLVYRSPENVPVVNEDGRLVLLARDMGYRGMTVFTERNGTEALYVGGVSIGSAFEHLPPHNGQGFPPPRLLRTVDGESWHAVPQRPGTFLGDLGKPLPGNKKGFKTFRALTPYKGKLFATVGDFRGVGVIIASEDPWAGNDTWQLASPGSFEQFPVWNLDVFNGFLYCTTGLEDSALGQGYGVYKTDAEGPPPYAFTPVVTDGGGQTIPALRSPNGLSFAKFNGQLYMGTNRPTELIRINPDDSWDLIVGEPRNTSQGFKAPLSGFGSGFASRFNGHFWRMAAHDNQLYLSTWDWSIASQDIAPLDRVFNYQYGLDFLRTDDGVHWTAISRTGLGDPHNTGGRSLLSTPAGLFLGTTNSSGGTQVFWGPKNVSPKVPAPTRLEAVSELFSGRQAILNWQASPGAARYRVYRSAQHPITDFVKDDFSITMPGTGATVTLDDIRTGALDSLCLPMASVAAESAVCAIVEEIKASALPRPTSGGFLTRYVLVGITANTSFVEDVPTPLQSVYFVRAEDADGNLSPMSNIVGAPSKAVPSASADREHEGDWEVLARAY